MTSISFHDIALTGCFTLAPDAPADVPASPSVGSHSSDPPTQAAVQGIGVYNTRVRPWERLQTLATPNPSWLVCHPGKRMVYAVNEVDRHQDQNTGALQVYRIESPIVASRPILTQVATRSLAPGATGPTHVAIDPQGRHLVVSSYSGGQFNVFELDAQGIPGEVTHAERLVGHGLDPDRQEAPHAHHATCAPTGDLWLTCDLGRDQVSLMRMKQAQLITTGQVSVTPGAGARHAVFHPTQPWIYVITEMHATLVRLTYDAQTGTLSRPDAPDDARRDTEIGETVLDEPLFDGQLFDGGLLTSEHPPSEVSLLPDGYLGEKSGSALVIHPSGRWLYASTRRTNSNHPLADSVSAWSIDTENGALMLIGRYATGLAFPRAMTLSPAGDTLYALNQKGGSIIAMPVNPESGVLDAPTVVAATPQPTCLAWLPGA